MFSESTFHTSRTVTTPFRYSTSRLSSIPNCSNRLINLMNIGNGAIVSPFLIPNETLLSVNQDMKQIEMNRSSS